MQKEPVAEEMQMELSHWFWFKFSRGSISKNLWWDFLTLENFPAAVPRHLEFHFGFLSFQRFIIVDWLLLLIEVSKFLYIPAFKNLRNFEVCRNYCEEIQISSWRELLDIL